MKAKPLKLAPLNQGRYEYARWWRHRLIAEGRDAESADTTAEQLADYWWHRNGQPRRDFTAKP